MLYKGHVYALKPCSKSFCTPSILLEVLFKMGLNQRYGLGNKHQ